MRTKKLLMMIALLCTIVQGAWAESVTFNVCSWDDVNKQVVTTTETKDCTVLAGNPGQWMQLGDADDQDHYYVVKGNVSYMTLNCFGRVHLILADDATLTCTGGIKVETANSDAKLFIYGQSQNTGKLIVTNSYKRAAGIGSSEAMGSGVITIHGGTLNVTGGQYAAGIGGGCSAKQSKSDGGVVTIYGGNIEVQGGDGGAGIGCGTSVSIAEFADSKAIVEATFGRFTLYGGTVTATGGEYSAGIGGGGGYQSIGANKKIRGSKCGEIYIYGGTLTAQGGKLGAGIGSGNFATYNKEDSSGKVYISGGTVNATGGENGAGIGGGRKSRGAQVEISGGTVNAKGGSDAAGIGGGEDANGGPLSISGGTVRAEGSEYGAGIGGGEYNVAPQKYYGIGADVTITGGTVIAIAGEKCNGREDYTGSAIGSGKGMHYKDSKNICGSFSIPDNYKVTGGDAENNPERVFTTDERDGARIWRNYVRIEPCTHTTPTVGSDQTKADTYTIGEGTHTMHCRYCAYTSQENHTFVDKKCQYCGKTNDTSDDLWSVTLHRASKAASASYADRVVMKVVKGQPFTIPAISATEGLTLMGYTTSWNSGNGIEMKDGETLTAVGTVVTPEDDISYYPRYRYRYVPTWTWNDADADATATLSIKCSALSEEAVSVTNITYDINDDVKTATATYDHNGATYTFTDTYLLPVGSLVLNDDSDNEDNLDSYRGRKVDMLRLSGRTLYADGKWNTLCLPFDLTDVYYNLGSCTLKTLGSSAYDSETGTLTLTFIDATSIEAGKPYLIKWTNDDSDRVSPMFYNVVISDADNAVTTDYVDFIGFFSPIPLTANDKSVLYLGADNKLYYPSADMTVGSCRAVFQLKGITAGDLTAGVRSFVMDFGDESTGITTTNDTNDTNSDGAWFTLDGRKLSQKPSQHGIYIKNGKKVVIK